MPHGIMGLLVTSLKDDVEVGSRQSHAQLHPYFSLDVQIECEAIDGDFVSLNFK